MRMAQKYKIQDLADQIKEVDKMILLHSKNPSKLMYDQYEYRKERLLSELIEELISLKNLSKYSFQLIYLAINKYYPDIIHSTEEKNKRQSKNKIPGELREIEAILAA